MKKQLIQKLKAGKVCIVANGKEAQAEVIKLAGEEGMQIEIAEEILDEQENGVVYFHTIKILRGRQMPLPMMVVAHAMPDCLVTSDEFKTQEEAFKAAAEEDLEVASWIFEAEEKPKANGCSTENALTGFMPSPAQVAKWIKRAEKRGFVPGAMFLGVGGDRPDVVRKIGKDGLSADDIGTFYKGSRIMIVKGDSSTWAKPLFKVVEPETLDYYDHIGVEILVSGMQSVKFAVVKIGRNEMGTVKVGLSSLGDQSWGLHFKNSKESVFKDLETMFNGLRYMVNDVQDAVIGFVPHKFENEEGLLKWRLFKD